MRDRIIKTIYLSEEISADKLFTAVEGPLQFDTVQKFREFYLTPMKLEGLVYNLACDRWALTEAGMLAYDKLIEPPPKPKAPKFVGEVVKPRQVDKFHGDHYSAPELGKTCNRPGAYDAFNLPSLIGNSRVNRKPVRE